MAKLNEYYERTAASDAHIIAMSACICLPTFHILIIVPVLDPTSKLEYFKKHWGPELHCPWFGPDRTEPTSPGFGPM